MKQKGEESKSFEDAETMMKLYSSKNLQQKLAKHEWIKKKKKSRANLVTKRSKSAKHQGEKWIPVHKRMCEWKREKQKNNKKQKQKKLSKQMQSRCRISLGWVCQTAANQNKDDNWMRNERRVRERAWIVTAPVWTQQSLFMWGH